MQESSVSVNCLTADATATAADISKGKTAYAKGEKLTGTMAVPTLQSLLTYWGSVTRYWYKNTHQSYFDLGDTYPAAGTVGFLYYGSTLYGTGLVDDLGNFKYTLRHGGSGAQIPLRVYFLK